MMEKNKTNNVNRLSGLECKICSNKYNNELIIATEKQLGLGDQFEYFVCSECYCLQIKDIPDNIEKYYPSNYYSFLDAKFPSKLNWLNFFLKRSLINYYMGYFDITGFFLSFIYENPFPWIRKKEINFNTKILDVGSGAGRKLLSLQRSGFINLTGIDPFIEEDIHYKNGVNVFKKDISEMDEKYDFIMLHHSFEHMQNPQQIVKHISRLLSPDGCTLIRVPVANSYAWHRYRDSWVGMDAPRHFFLHTSQSMNILLNETCLIIPNAISPNGDLINDVWNIGMIDLYPSMEIKIFNRWGQTMWRSEKGYPQPWDGRSNGSLLPIDSYHYIIDLHNGTKPLVGNVTIVR